MHEINVTEALDVPVMTPARTYEVDPSRSALELRVGDYVITKAGELGGLNGDLILTKEDASGCRIRLWTDGAPPIRFYSWRCRRIARGQYWVPGALTIRGLTVLTPLRVRGPIPEMTDPQGDLRSGAVASVKVGAEGIGLDWPSTEVILSFQIELVRRMPRKAKA